MTKLKKSCKKKLPSHGIMANNETMNIAVKWLKKVVKNPQTALMLKHGTHEIGTFLAEANIEGACLAHITYHIKSCIAS